LPSVSAAAPYSATSLPTLNSKTNAAADGRAKLASTQHSKFGAAARLQRPGTTPPDQTVLAPEEKRRPWLDIVRLERKREIALRQFRDD